MLTRAKLVSLILLVLVVAGCMGVKKEEGIKTKLHEIRNYTIYYGNDEIDKLSKYDLVVLDPDNYSKREIEFLKKNETVVVAYLSLGEISRSKPYFKLVKDCVIGRNPIWNSYYVNVSCEKYKKVILYEVIPKILSKGFDGLFLDCVDVVDIYPEMKSGMVDLIKSIREKYPDIILIQNRGFSVLNETAQYVNGVLFECFTTHYNWTSKRYELWKGDDLKWIDMKAKELIKLKEKYNLIVLTLDYAENKTLKEICVKHAEKYGFIPFTSNIYLNRI